MFRISLLYSLHLIYIPVISKMTTDQGKRKAMPPSITRNPKPLSSSSSSSSSSSLSPSSSRTTSSKRTTQAQPHKPTAAPTTTKPAKPSREPSHGSKSQSEQHRSQHRGQPLEAASILNNPRLQQVTGLHPRKLSSWAGVRPPIDELARLQWAMSLPDVYPVKRPRGNF
ncbi:hypothetical protein GGR54DRAFT_491063 [Hypoxylon sp. NC1633]|nr:hypothetical protein GGR54DRAFT_491063 [Hypoxylon sp. NC1633]